MAVKQISVFIENRAGTLVEATDAISKAGVDIRAVSLSDTTNFGILRVIVDKPEAAETALRDAGYTVSITSVIAIGLNDSPGGLCAVAKLAAEHGMNLDYIYAFVSHSTDDACIIARVADIARAEELFKANGFRVFTEHEVYNI